MFYICTANSGGGVEDDDLNFRITSCGISLIFGSCRLYRNFATVILFQMISPTATPTSTVSNTSKNVIKTAPATAPSYKLLGQVQFVEQHSLSSTVEPKCVSFKY